MKLQGVANQMSQEMAGLRLHCPTFRHRLVRGS
ncbi:protein of unknown function [Azospirillum baldaniorum]|uniref:Uncharacterized protein n=1 Tax=Azospirillum baldaniorum TaxID=1064539 RepID=A0A9P1JRS7_9PROT|nr:protein of unknown function [Azospirillum baldaniorum]